MVAPEHKENAAARLKIYWASGNELDWNHCISINMPCAHKISKMDNDLMEQARKQLTSDLEPLLRGSAIKEAYTRVASQQRSSTI